MGKKTCKKIRGLTKILPKTTEHHERNVTCVLEPYYNLAHALTKPHSDLANLLALAPPLLKLKQQSVYRWSMNCV